MTKDDEYKVKMFGELVARNEALHKEVYRLQLEVADLYAELLAMNSFVDHKYSGSIEKYKLDK